MTTRRQTDFSVDGAEVKWTEDILVVLERTAFMSCTHEVVVGRAAVATAADGRSRLGTDVTSLAPHSDIITAPHLSLTNRVRQQNNSSSYVCIGMFMFIVRPHRSITQMWPIVKE